MKLKYFFITFFVLVIIGFGYKYRHGVVLPPWMQKMMGQSVAAASDNHDSVRVHPGEVILGDQALRNIGITNDTIHEAKPGHFRLMTSYPGIVVTRPGRSEIEISAPAAGTIVRIYHEPGQAIPPNAPLFDIDLTNEEFVEIQAELILSYQKFDIIEQELKRLKPLSEDVTPKTYRDATFQKLELETTITLLRKKLLLYGLSDDIIDFELRDNQRIVKVLTVRVPEVTDEWIVRRTSILGESEPESTSNSAKPLQMVSLFVEKGIRVASGQSLGKIADYSQLFIQGSAFDYDEAVISEGLKRTCAITAAFDGHEGKAFLNDLCMRYVDSRIDSQNRTLAFYVDLPNERLDDGSTGFIDWKFKPGQRCELRLETENITDCFDLPRTAIAGEGAEISVFVYAGDKDGMKIWKKTPVHLLRQDRDRAAVANDGSLKPGQRIAMTGAAQLLVALNTSSGATQLESACADTTHDHSEAGHSH